MVEPDGSHHTHLGSPSSDWCRTLWNFLDDSSLNVRDSLYSLWSINLYTNYSTILPACQPLNAHINLDPVEWKVQNLTHTTFNSGAFTLLVSKYTMRVEYYTDNDRYTLVVDGRLILYTSSKSIADYYYARALKHTSSSSELYSIPISPSYTSSWCSCSSKRTILWVEPIPVEFTHGPTAGPFAAYTVSYTVSMVEMWLFLAFLGEPM